MRLNMRSYKAKQKRRARSKGLDRSDHGCEIDLAKELRSLEKDLNKGAKVKVHLLRKYRMLPEVDRDAMPFFGLSPDPREWTHNEDDTTFFEQGKVRTLRLPFTAKA